MSDKHTLFLRLEGPLQAWGNHESKFVVRRISEAPTKSGIIGLLCAALGVSRSDAATVWLPKLAALRMGVRVDAPGVRWWDYHTVGAEMQMRTAEGKHKPGAMLTRREYLCDGSFLVALQGDTELITQLTAALESPKWTLYLGRKACVPSVPLLERPRNGEAWANPASIPSGLLDALKTIPWRRRMNEKYELRDCPDPRNHPPETVDCLLDWEASPDQPEAPADAEVWYDVPLTFEPPAHRPRFVIRKELTVGKEGELSIAPASAQNKTSSPPRPRADYKNSEYRKMRLERLAHDQHLCIFCKSPATTVQHITYRHAGGNEHMDELRSLCRLCHDAVTMLEYGAGMGLDRINPEEERWRDQILQKREEIIRFRSLENRRRKLAAEEVE